MAEQNQENSGGDLDADPGKGAKSIAARWGLKVTKIGYCPVPSLLLRAQRRLACCPDNALSAMRVRSAETC